MTVTLKKTVRILGVVAIACSPLLLNASCSPVGVVAGGAATVGVASAQEGGLSQAASDAKIQLYINDAWIRHDAQMFRKLDMTIKEGRVLLTGVVQKPQQRVDAVRLAWQAPGVKQVLNEITVSESEGVSGYARDTLIGTQLRAKLTFDKDIYSINYSIDCVGGVVYLMGVAQSREELEKVIAHARNIAYVQRVVSYVRLKEEAVPDQAVPEAQVEGAAGEPVFVQ